MARFTSAGGGGGEPGPQGPSGNNGTNGSDGLDSLFLGTWNSETEFLAVYQGGPVGLADGDWWAFVKDNTDPNKIYVVRENPNSATGWVIDDNECFVLPAGSQGDTGADGADGTDALWDYLGEYNGGIVYGAGAVVTYDGQLWYRNVYTSAGYVPGVGNTYWDLLAAKGADGTDGNDGAPGAQGDPGSPALVYLGNYVSGNGYIANLAVVKGSDNNLYIATSSGGLGDPVGNSAEWSIFLPKGADGEDATLPQDLGTTDNPTFNKITLTSNGAIDNITIGDDVLIGDGNVANNLVIIGYQDPTNGGVVLGNNKTEQVSSDGSNLTLEADNDIILYPGSSYAYLGTPTVGGETRIATRGYVDALGTTTSTYSPSWTGTGLAYTGTPAVGSYVKIGKLVTFHIQVTLTNVTNFGTGQYFITLPFAPIGDYAFRDGGIHAAGNHYTVMADAEAGTTSMDLWYIASSGQDMPMDHNSPHTLTTTSKFYINGTYIAA
jgi:hypothetical protein